MNKSNERIQIWVSPSTKEAAFRLKSQNPKKKLYEIIDEAVCEKAMGLDGVPREPKKTRKHGFFPKF